MHISKTESCDFLVVQLGALLHDIADSKFHDGDETVGPKTARKFLESENVDEETIAHVISIIENISFKGGNVEMEIPFHRTRISCRMPIASMRLVRSELRVRSITADSKTGHYTIPKLRQ